MHTNWWTEEVSRHFQQFYEDLIAGKRTKLALMAPPQHGKSKAVNDFIAWLAGEMSIGSWKAEYQQNPMVIGGGLIEHVAGECSIPTC